MVDNHNFDLMREAFELKIYAKATDVYISERLNDNDFYRLQKSGKRIYMNINTLRRIWKDPFYYGIYEVGGKRSDQRVDNPQYKPLITEAEYELLKEEYTKRTKRQLKKVSVPDKYHSIIPLPPGMLIDSEGYPLVRYVAKMKEFNQKLEELRETNPRADYDDVVSSRHIRYRVSNKESKSYKLELTFDKIEEAIIKKLDQINIDEKELAKYLAYKEQEFIMENKIAREQRIKITEEINQLAEQKEQYARDNIHFRRSMQHKDEYQEQLKSFDKQINKLEKEFKKIKFDERNILREFEVFVSILQNIGEYYRNASFVQRKNLSEILRLNILVDREKGLTVQANPSIESLFSEQFSVSGGAENRTPV